MEQIRLQRFLSQAGVASRRAAEALIAGGRIEVDGRPVTVPGTKVDPATSDVRVDGERVRPARPDYVLLHKPAGCMTTRADPKGRPTVMDLLPGGFRHLFPVGRLDWDTEGVLLLTNDGELAHRMMHPRFGAERLYRVKVAGLPRREDLQRIARGVFLRGGRRSRAQARLVSRSEKNAHLEFRLREGRHGEIKDICRAIGHPALKILRVGYAGISLAGLPRGRWRRLRGEELSRLRRSLGTDARAGAPEA